MLRRIATLVLALGLSAPIAAAQEPGPTVGAKAPPIAMAVDQSAKPRDLASLTGQKGLVLVFIRSASW